MYFDTAYIAKFYLNEPDSIQVRQLMAGANSVHSSELSAVEFHAVLHRRVREGEIQQSDALSLVSEWSAHVESGVWKLIPMGKVLLDRTGLKLIDAPKNIFLRAGDAIHLMTAYELGEREVWTNDRHMLKAAPYFGLKGRSV